MVDKWVGCGTGAEGDWGTQAADHSPPSPSARRAAQPRASAVCTYEWPVAGMKYRQQWTRVSGMRFFRLMLTSSCRYFSYWSLMNFMMGCQLHREAPVSLQRDTHHPSWGTGPRPHPQVRNSPSPSPTPVHVWRCLTFQAETRTSLPC